MSVEVWFRELGNYCEFTGKDSSAMVGTESCFHGYPQHGHGSASKQNPEKGFVFGSAHPIQHEKGEKL
ncbi:MAG: hypothetical protein V8R75_06570 [Oscillospiraceae bacterium]